MTVSVFPRMTKVWVPSAGIKADTGQAVYAVRSETFDPQSDAYRGQLELMLAEMTTEIEQAVRQKGESVVHLRVDKNLSYAEVQPVLQVSWTVTELRPGRFPAIRCQIQTAICSEVGFSSPSISLR